MTKETKKPEGKVTKAGAVELEENELNEVSGGSDIYLKIAEVDGDVTDGDRATDLPQIVGVGSYKLDTTGATFKR